eukprot:CAMPEP_0202913810 /NCGR_PEP_ID=MMETSP1392-20130828/61537_1 /ASSEMBLY_ACC=CAM_ASM_000868 /TAXON_ID=225041 /ORGANISM="Chlamydomonas chlamydogama, Strain SAG 11-48b" /LENGTH=242 /DNA_ID=CAMNT_0049605221 /DNA_START=62 /DNA_END=790 /DNA_ORIENTATION=-
MMLAARNVSRAQAFQAAQRLMVSNKPFLDVRHLPSGRGHTQQVRVLSESADMAIGTQAPDFELVEPKTGQKIKLSSFSKGASATLVMFLANHCKYVVLLKEGITALAKEYQAKGVKVVAVSSSSIQTHPQDGPDKMVEDATKYGYTFPYLYDESQDVAKAYKAACTPEFYVFDKDLKLVYHGQFDDARPSSDKPVTGADLRAALDAAVKGAAAPRSRPSIGCNIKWHPGNEPAYFGAQVVKK